MNPRLAKILATLLLVAWVMHLLLWFIVAVGIVLAVRAWLHEVGRRRHAHEAQVVEHFIIAARADQQHNWVMQGDDRGTYGIGTPAMRAYWREVGR